MAHQVLMLSWRIDGDRVARLEEHLARRGCTLIPAPPDDELSREQVKRLIEKADGVIAGAEHRIDAELMDAAPGLRVISALGIGYDQVEVDAASARGIVVANCAGCNEHSVAELTIGMMIALTKHLVPLDHAARAGTWEVRAGLELQELWGKTLGIVGLGRIGKAVALAARALGMHVLANDVAWDVTFANQNGITYVPLDDLLVQSDIVTIHTPLTEQTRGLIDTRALGLMKPTGYLINTARGPIVEEAALVEALRSGRPAGAGLDVFAIEPHTNNPFAALPNVILTPHVGGSPREAVERMLHLAVTNVTNVLHGLPAHHQVNVGVEPVERAGLAPSQPDP